jgi:hypothetical protein
MGCLGALYDHIYVRPNKEQQGKIDAAARRLARFRKRMKKVKAK